MIRIQSATVFTTHQASVFNEHKWNAITQFSYKPSDDTCNIWQNKEISATLAHIEF